MDGRWYCLGIVAIYFAVLALSGPIETMRARWKHAGLYATGPTFLDLRLFPAARAEFAAGGNPYVSNPRDPDKRPYNYPRLWLFFLRFSAEDKSVTIAGIVLALSALLSLLFYWGPMSVPGGVYAGVLLCTPAIMLGVEKGNTDLFILALLAVGLRMVRNLNSTWQKEICSSVFLLAAGLKLFPAFAFPALPSRSFRGWIKTVGAVFVLFGAYVVVTLPDVLASVRNTFAGLWWVQSYGARAPIFAAQMYRSYHGLPAIDIAQWTILATSFTAIAYLAAAFWGWRRGLGRLPPIPESNPGQLAGFRAAALIYCFTYVAGANFDYRQCFLLLALPQLFRWSTSSDRHHLSARFTLAAMLFSCGTNFVMAGWPGFFLNEAAGFLLGPALVGLCAMTWSSEWSVPNHDSAR